MFPDGKSYDLEDASLSSHLYEDSEIFEVRGEELIYISSINKKRLVYICTEIAEYIYGKYNHKHLPIAKKHLELSRRWLNDEPISRKEFESLIKDLYEDTNITDCCAELGTLIFNNYSKKNIISSHFVVYHSGQACRDFFRTNAEKDDQEEAEYIRQAKFIIDFLKSDKSLFMV